MKPLDNENGSILILSLLFLAALAVLGAMAMNATTYEIKLAGNDKALTRLKFKAESTAMAAAERFEHLPDDQKKDEDWSQRPAWFSNTSARLGIDPETYEKDYLNENKQIGLIDRYVSNLDNWVDDPEDPNVNCAVLASEADEDSEEFTDFSNKYPNCRYTVFDVSTSEGTTLGMGNTIKKSHNLYITGLSEQGSARKMIQIGYRAEFE